MGTDPFSMTCFSILAANHKDRDKRKGDCDISGHVAKLTGRLTFSHIFYLEVQRFFGLLVKAYFHFMNHLLLISYLRPFFRFPR